MRQTGNDQAKGASRNVNFMHCVIENTNPEIVARAEHTIAEVLADHEAA
jgi:hypothetical protein